MIRKLILVYFMLSTNLFLANPTLAQTKEHLKKNTITIGWNELKIFNIYRIYTAPFPVLRASYSRALNEKVSIKAGYSYWRESKMFSTIRTSIDFRSLFSLNNKKGDLYRSNQFQYFDIDFRYQIKIQKRHNVGFATGPSLLMFNNYYIRSVSSIILLDGRHHLIATDTYGTPRERAFGVTFTTEYNYSLWKNRINIGAEIRGRYYPDKVPFHLVYGLQLGYNF